MLEFYLSWGGMGYSVHVWHGPNGPVKIKHQFKSPTAYNVSTLNDGVWPCQIPGPNTVSLEYACYEDFPPAGAVDALWKAISENYLESLAYRNANGLPAEPCPVKPTPVMYSMDKHMFIDATGQPAHATAPEEF